MLYLHYTYRTVGCQYDFEFSAAILKIFPCGRRLTAYGETEKKSYGIQKSMYIRKLYVIKKIRQNVTKILKN